MVWKIAEFRIERTRDVALSAQRARLLASLAGIVSRRRTGFSKAVKEIAANAVAYAGGGMLEFRLAEEGGRQFLEAAVCDHGPGILNLPEILSRARDAQAGNSGIGRAQRWVERFVIQSEPQAGTTVCLAEPLPSSDVRVTEPLLADWAAALSAKSSQDALGASMRRLREVYDELATAQFRHAEHHLGLPDTQATGSRLALAALAAGKTDYALVVMDQGGRIQWANEAFVRITGYELDEVAGRRTIDVLHGPQTDPNMVQEIDEAFDTHRGLSLEILHYRKDARTYWAAANITPVLDETGDQGCWVLVFSDVTKRHQAQEALEKARLAAEAANKAKSEFLANMSHEIRTPMNAVIGMTELALCTDLTAEQQDYLATVKESADALLRLLNDILDLSKIEAGKLEIDSVEFNLADLLGETMKALAVRGSQKGLEIAWHLPPEVPEQLIGDPARLRQILINLVGNAIKFTHRGEVIVRVEPQWQTETEVALHFAVSDTGVGIPADRLERIFEAFTQVDSSTTRRFGGTGLGLTISSQLIELMGGHIWVQSKTGKGSTFHFSVRFGLHPQPSAAVPGGDGNQFAGKSVLLVDDNATNRRILKERLQSLGMRPTVAGSGQAALAALRKAAARGRLFAMMLADAAMSGMDGFELVEQIGRTPELNIPTVMMLSSADRPRDMARCRELGVAACLTKPVAGSDLLDAVRQALGQSAAERRVAVPAETSDENRPVLRVLVADDNAANRVLATRILQKRGHQVLAVASGQEAVAAIGREAFNVVLLDVQMPGMDGFATTAALRQREQETQTHLPIIAMTAYAMKGDRERCLAAGMDAYVAKPVRARELQTLVESLGAPAEGTTDAACGLIGRRAETTEAVGEPVAEAIPPAEADEVPPPTVRFDFEPALARLEGDLELLKEQMSFFLEDAPRLAADIRSAIARRDSRALQLAAHRLKGLAGNFDAERAVDSATRLELLGQTAAFDETEPVRQQLELCTAQLQHALRNFLGTH